MDPKDLVRSGYDAMAAQYLASKDADDALLLDLLGQLARLLPDGAAVLDLGCGAGVPCTRWLAGRYAVTGVDISERQLELARALVPGATLIRSDMAALEFVPASFDAVTAFYSIIHLPREEQPDLLQRIRRWLKPGGVFLANWAVGAWEGTEPDWQGWGATMWWSHYDEAGNLAMLQAAGFKLLYVEKRSSAGETWLWTIATS